MKRCTELHRSFMVVTITILFIAIFLLSGCPENESAYKLPDTYKPDAVKIALPTPEYIWPRSGGGFNARNVSTLEGPSSLKMAWEVKMGEGAVLSPVIDDQGKIYTGILGGALTCLSPDGETLFNFGGAKESDPVADTLRAQPALGENQVWLVTDGGLVCLDFDGKEVFRIAAPDLPEGGLSNIALAPYGGIVATSRGGWIILFDENCQPTATVKTKGSAASPASFNVNDIAFVPCSDKCIYAVSKEGRLTGQMAASGAFLSTPVIGEERTYAVCMDGNVYCGDYQGRQRWSSDLLFDAIGQSEKLKAENEAAILGLYWSPMLRLDAPVEIPEDTEKDSEPDTTAEESDTQSEGFDLVTPFVDRTERLKDASVVFSWVNEEGDRKMRKVMATSFIAEVEFGAQPVMDSTGNIYFAWDNIIAVAKGKDVISKFTMTGEAKVSGSQLVITKDKRVLLPMNDGRLICFEEAPPTDAVEENTTTAEGTEVPSDGENIAAETNGSKVTLSPEEKESTIKFAKGICKQIFDAETDYYGEKMELVGFAKLVEAGYLDIRYQSGEFSQLGVRATIDIDNSIPDYKVTIEMPGDIGVIIMARDGTVKLFPPDNTEGIFIGFAPQIKDS